MDPRDQVRDRDPQNNSVGTDEHSLVGRMPDDREALDEGQPLDAAMNGTQPEKPVVEEASDF